MPKQMAWTLNTVKELNPDWALSMQYHTAEWQHSAVRFFGKRKHVNPSSHNTRR